MYQISACTVIEVQTFDQNSSSVCVCAYVVQSTIIHDIIRFIVVLIVLV